MDFWLMLRFLYLPLQFVHVDGRLGLGLDEANYTLPEVFVLTLWVSTKQDVLLTT
jgi:hypothetical protein